MKTFNATPARPGQAAPSRKQRQRINSKANPATLNLCAFVPLRPCVKNEFELTLNKLSAAQRTGEPVALTPRQCELLLNRLDELMFALERA